jgi:3-oxoacyl-[acyl-carrier-protein] synthase-1
MENRVVITGMGIYSCIGISLDEVKNSLFQGQSGIVLDQNRKEFGYRSRRQRISMGEESEYAYIATTDALKQAGINQGFFDHNEVGILYGNDSVSQAVVEATDIVREKKDTTLMGSGSIFKSMNSTVTMNLSTIFRLRGINLTISAACASGSHSLGLAYLMIKSGLQDMIVCGGAQETNKFSMISFDGLGVFSVREDEPAKASRPFDSGRDGLVPSGGAATLIVESLESAQKRGANILAEITGYGFSSNGGHISTPNVDGPALAMERALKQAGLTAKDIDYINAHATSTPLGDANEAKAIYEIFGSEVPVSSTKSMTGHECWMAGASEVIYSILMMQNDFIAPNINLDHPDDDAQKINLVTKTKNQKIDVFLSNSFGFGGTNSALIVKKFA